MAELFTTSLFSDASLISYYRMEGNSTDAKGANNGTDTAITYNVGNGKYNQGAGFNGTTSKIDLGTSTTLNPVALTYVAWVRASAFTNAYNAVVARTTNADGSKFASLFVKSTGKLACYVFGNASISYDGIGSNTLVTGAWYHLAMTYSSTDGLRGYVNGVQDGTAAANGAITTITGNSYIGQDVFYTPRFWTDAIDDVGIFGRVLTPTEILSLYQDTQNGLLGADI